MPSPFLSTSSRPIFSMSYQFYRHVNHCTFSLICTYLYTTRIYLSFAFTVAVLISLSACRGTLHEHAVVDLKYTFRAGTYPQRVSVTLITLTAPHVANTWPQLYFPKICALDCSLRFASPQCVMAFFLSQFFTAHLNSLSSLRICRRGFQRRGAFQRVHRCYFVKPASAAFVKSWIPFP